MAARFGSPPPNTAKGQAGCLPFEARAAVLWRPLRRQGVGRIGAIEDLAVCFDGELGFDAVHAVERRHRKNRLFTAQRHKCAALPD